MKRWKRSYNILTFLFVMVISLLFVQTVNAETLTSDRTTMFWSSTFLSDGKAHSWYYTTYSFNGRVAYCIEPGVNEGTDNYIVGDWSNTNYSNELKIQAILIAYYGYEYPSHNTEKYRMATQALIWELFGKQNVIFSTQRWGLGTIIDISAEREEIMSLVNSHYQKPSFNGTQLSLKVGETYTLVDTNNVLSNYEVVLSDNIDYSIDGNTLTIKPTATGTLTISFKKKMYMEREYLVYYGDGIQKMLSTGSVDPVVSAVTINTTGGSVSFSKKDYDNLSYTGEATLEGAVYGIYDANTDQLIAEVTTDATGYASYGSLPYIGDYYLQEITPSEGYQLDTTKHYFSSTLENPDVTIEDIYEHIIEVDVEITKVYATNESKIMTPEPNVEFGIYDKDSKLIKTITTDKNGKASFNLVYGTYTVKQLTTSYGTEKADDFTILVNKISDKKYYTISNANITAKLKVTKVDSDTGKVIAKSGIKFKIYDNLKGEYVSQTITYPSAETISIFETDSNGILYTPYPLSSGNYVLYEIDQEIDGYLWNNNGISFTIDENTNFTYDDDYGTLIEVTFPNQEVKGEIVINKVGEKIVFENNSYYYEETALDGVVYNLYAKEDIISGDGTKIYIANELIGTYETKDGIISISDLYLGTYYLVEKLTLDDFVLDTNEYILTLEYKDQYTPTVKKEITLKNYLKKGTLEFTKLDLTTSEGIPNTKLEIYTENEKLIYSGITNEDGKIIIENLPVGKYYIVESEATTGYKLSDEKVYFEILEDGEIVKANMTNEKIKGTLEFTKLDLTTGNPLSGVVFEIYDDQDNLIFSGTTNEDGKIIIEDLEYGKYYILEKEPIDGYSLSNEKVYFEILEDGEIVKASMTNEKTVVEVPSTGITDLHFIEIFGVVLIISGIGITTYVKKKK